MWFIIVFWCAVQNFSCARLSKRRSVLKRTRTVFFIRVYRSITRKLSRLSRILVQVLAQLSRQHPVEIYLIFQLFRHRFVRFFTRTDSLSRSERVESPCVFFPCDSRPRYRPFTVGRNWICLSSAAVKFRDQSSFVTGHAYANISKH